MRTVEQAGFFLWSQAFADQNCVDGESSVEGYSLGPLVTLNGVVGLVSLGWHFWGCLCSGAQAVNISLPGDEVSFYVAGQLLIFEDFYDSAGAQNFHA